MQRPRSVFFNIFLFLIILLKNFIILLEFLFFSFFFFPRGVRGELEKEKHLIKVSRDFSINILRTRNILCLHLPLLLVH